MFVRVKDSSRYICKNILYTMKFTFIRNLKLKVMLLDRLIN